MRQLAHSEVIDDEQRHAGQVGKVGLAGVGERRLGELFQEGMGFAIEDPVTLVDGGPPDRLGEMALAGPGRTEEEGVLALGDEASGRELVDEGAMHLLVEGEVEAVERAVGVAEAGLLEPTREETVLAALELVGDERRDEIDRRERFGLGVLQADVQCVGHAGEAKLPEGLVEFDEIHDGSPVLRSMRSRYSVSCRMSGSTCRSASGTGGRRSR